MFKVVKNGDFIVAFGPDDENYIPFIKEGEILEIWPNEPTQDQIQAGIAFNAEAV